MSEATEKATWSCRIGTADRRGLPDGADAPLRKAVERAYFELTGREADFCSSGWGDDDGLRDNPHLSAEQRAEIEDRLDQLRYVEGWQGTPPAEGTRRALIRDALAARIKATGPEGEFHDLDGFALALADVVEEALIRVVDQGATPESGSPASVAMDVLDGLGIDRTREGAILTIADRVTALADELLKDFGIARACRDCAEEQLGHGAKEVDGRRDDTIKSLTLRCDSLLAQRESARAGEDHFKAQRDAALHLVRWLIGDLIPSHLVDLTDEEGH